MKLMVTGKRNPQARGGELVVLAHATAPGRPWRPVASWAARRHWHANEQVLVGGWAVPGVVANPGARLRLPGHWPLLLVLAHPWSGIVRFSAGLGSAEVDLYLPRTSLAVLDPRCGIAVEVPAEGLLGDAAVSGTAAAGIDVLPETVRHGRWFQPVRSPALPWPRRRRDARTLWQRRPFFEIRQGLSWLMARLLRPSHAHAREAVLHAAMEGLLQRAAPAPVPIGEQHSASGQPADAGAMESRLVLLSSAIEGLTQRLARLELQGTGTAKSSEH